MVISSRSNESRHKSYQASSTILERIHSFWDNFSSSKTNEIKWILWCRLCRMFVRLEEILYLPRRALFLLELAQRKNPIVTRWSSEAMPSGTAEIIRLTFLLRDIKIPLKQAPQLFCDEKSALFMTIKPVSVVKEKVAIRALITRYIPSSFQIANIFTKPQSKLPCCFFLEKLRNVILFMLLNSLADILRLEH